MPVESINLGAALADLLVRVEAGMGQAFVGYDSVAEWEPAALSTLLSAGLLEPAAAATSLECAGCEERCFSDVVVQASQQGDVRAFIVCDVPHKQEEMGRVAVRRERLAQWISSAPLLARFIARELRLSDELPIEDGIQPIALGMLKGPQGRRWVKLCPQSLELEANRSRVPVNELLFVEGGKILLDEPRIQSLLEQPTSTATKPYTANTDRREAGKLETQEMYRNWQDAYDQLREDHPGQNKTWYAAKLARMDIAQGRAADTIRKNIS